MSNHKRNEALIGAAKTSLWLCVFLALGWLFAGPLLKGKSDEAASATDGGSWLVREENSRVKELGKEYRSVSFGYLSDYDYYSPEPGEKPDPALAKLTRIPDDIKTLNGKKVAITGFMMPLTYGEDGAKEFVLNGNYDMCGFGGPVALNQWMMVKYTGRDKAPFTHLPITVFGALEVGEERKDGRVFSLYRMQANAISTPQGVSVGIYGVMSYAVSQRTREIGIRMAMGAQARNVLKLVISQGAKLIGIGLGLGLIISFIAARLMTSLLYQVGAADPLTYLFVAALLTAVALLACYIPARRATKVDPMIALRSE